jgi:diguanylate cyclase (GGDEF)-like protein
MDQPPAEVLSHEDAAALVRALDQLLTNGKIGSDTPAHLLEIPGLAVLVERVSSLQQFTLAVSQGNLDLQLTVKGRIAGSMKALQANLRHLTWQVQRVADGDLSQRVVFMGEFSAAFNRMTQNLAEARTQLEERAEELARQREVALSLMLDAQDAREEAETANRQLYAQLLEIQSLQEKLHEQAIRDPLTGCFNRRFLIESIMREFSRAQREGYPISLLMLDVDHFKRVNDTYGHQTGDIVLQHLGELLRSTTRQADISARYGGEEFVQVYPNMSLENAIERAEIIRAAFSTFSIPHVQMSGPLTISIGVASFPEHGLIYEEVLEHADKALYQAKNTGRNRVVSYKE